MKLIETISSVVKDVNKISTVRGYNKYIKKYPIEKMFMLLLYQQYSAIDTGRAFTIYLKHMIGDTTETISQSELSKKLSHKLDYRLFKEMYGLLLYQAKGLRSQELKKLERMIRIVDSTALSATATMKYAKHRKNKNGFKMHTVIDGSYLLEDFRLKNGSSSDKKSLKWAIRQGYIHIFDKGYSDYSQFKWISERNAYFVTRAQANIHFSIVRNRKVGRNQTLYGIESDRIIDVIENRKTGELFRMRMVTFNFVDSTGTEQQFSLLSNLMNYRSDDIAKLYRERWNIEVVFRWIKTFLNIDHWMSRSRNGVLIQLYTALCAYLIALITKMKNQKRFRIMKDCIYEYMYELKKILKTFEVGSNIEDFLLEES
jgi:hypothetical protein